MQITDHDKVLKAATAVSDGGKKSFSGPDLVAATWEHYPDDFGLPGKNKSHPDTCKVILTLTGNFGLVAKGFLRGAEARKYVVTDAGLNYTAELFNEYGLATGLAKAQYALLSRLLASAAFAKVEAGQREKVWKSEVDDFYGLTPGPGIDATIEAVTMELTMIESKLEDVGEVKVGNVKVDAGTARLLKNIGDLILGLHQRHLAKLRMGL